jgi:hypothetical protein
MEVLRFDYASSFEWKRTFELEEKTKKDKGRKEKTWGEYGNEKQILFPEEEKYFVGEKTQKIKNPFLPIPPGVFIISFFLRTFPVSFDFYLLSGVTRQDMFDF